MVQRSTTPYREAPAGARTDDERYAVKLLYEGPLYGPSDSRHSDQMSEECRVRVVRTFRQVGDGERARVAQRNEVEVTLGCDKLGARVWRPASELGSSYANVIIDAVALGVAG